MTNAFEDTEKMPEGLQFLTYEEVAIILKVKRATVRSWVYRGLLRSNVKMGKKSLIPISEVRRFVAERTQTRDKKVFPIRKPDPGVENKVVSPQPEPPEEDTGGIPKPADLP